MKVIAKSTVLVVASIITIAGLTIEARAVTIVNAGFEDVSGQTVFNEFTFGAPASWGFYDPNNVIPDSGTFTGTLEPNGIDFFNTTAPEGVKVSILFNSGREGEGEYGYVQNLSDTLQANTDYVLTVEIGNIASGTAQNGQFFNLDEFPGYRVELMAGGVVIAQDDNSLVIGEREWETSTVSISVGATHPELGQNLGIRLVNLNVLPDGYTQVTSPDLEVDFDDVALSATPVTALPGDINLDGAVDRLDAALLVRNLGLATGADFTDGDLNDDDAVTLVDWSILQTNLGQSFAAPAASATVPEPNTLTLATLGLLACTAGRRRRRR